MITYHCSREEVGCIPPVVSESTFTTFLLTSRHECGGTTPNTQDGATENAGVENAIRSKMHGWKMQEWKIREYRGSRGGKCRSRLAVWKAEPILYSDTALSYFSKIVFRLLSE